MYKFTKGQSEMCLIQKALLPVTSRVNPCFRRLMVLLAALSVTVTIQAQQPQPTATPAPNAPAEAGGPTGDIGPIAVPKKKEEPPKKEEPAERPKKVDGVGDFSMKV